MKTFNMFWNAKILFVVLYDMMPFYILQLKRTDNKKTHFKTSNWFELELISKENVLISAKNAQVMVMWFLGFQNSCCFANNAHCCVTFMIIKFVVGIVLVIVTKFDVKLQQSTSMTLNFKH